jgi:Spy/CpxP family protein refolding chaperone
MSVSRQGTSHRQRLALPAVLLVSLAAAALGACERDSPSSPSQTHAAPAVRAPHPPAGRAAMPPAVQGASLTGRAWWNHPDLIDALSLTPEQRTKLDEMLRRSMETQRAAQQHQREQQRALKQAVDAGSWDAARRAAAAAAESMSSAWQAQTTLKIDVLASLDQNQQQLIMSRYPQLLRQTSVLTRWRGNARRPPTPGG